MRIVPLLLASLLLAVGFSALAPVAQAKPYCTWSERDCDGLVCLYRPETCVGDRCWFTCWGPEPHAAAEGAPFPCSDIYSYREVGPVAVEQRSSCEYHVYLFGEPILA